MRPNVTRAALALACVLAACDSGGNAAPDTLSTTPVTASLPATTTTSPPETTGSVVPVTGQPGEIQLSPDGPWTRVDSAPGVTQPGLVYLLMPGVWVWLPTVEDIPNGVTWVLNEDDLPVIEAYLQARLVFFRAITSSPMDLSSAGWQQWYADGGAAYKDRLQPRVDQGQVADLDVGVVLRPEVMGEERSDTTALIVDCVLDGGVFLLPDGSLAPGSTRGVEESGSAFRLVLSDNWQVTEAGSFEQACHD